MQPALQPPDAHQAAAELPHPQPAPAEGPGPPSERLDELLLQAERLLGPAVEGDEDAVHDLRVCLRRIRVLCRELSGGKGRGARELDELRAGATGLFRALGGIRDLDILRRELRGLVRSGALEDPIQPDLAAWLEDERKRLRTGVPAAVSFFCEELARFRAAGPPTGRFHAADRRARSSRATLRRRARRLLKQLARVESEDREGESPEAGAPWARLHRLRIRGKQLRYALEAHGQLDRAGGDPLESGLKKLQDALGSVQDAAMAVARLDALARGGTLSPAAAGPARVAAANERDRRRAEFLHELRTGVYANLLNEVRDVTAKEGQGRKGDSHAERRAGDSPSEPPTGDSRDAERVLVEKIPGIGAAKVRHLAEAGLATLEALRAASLEELAAVQTIGPHQARMIKQFVEGSPDGAGEALPQEGEVDGKRFERTQSVLALSAVVSDYATTLAEELSRHEEGDAVRTGRQAESLVDRLVDLPGDLGQVSTKKLKGLRSELRQLEGLLAKVLDLDASTLKMNKLRKALKAHRKAIDAYLA